MAARKPAIGRPRTTGTATGGQVQSLNRGLTLLERLAESEAGLLLTDLAQQVGLPTSTTHRLLATLEQARFVHQEPDTGRWLVGVQAFTVGSAFLADRDVVRRSHGYLRALMESAGETANLAVPDQDEAVFVSQVQCREMMRMLVRIGSRAPLHASGVGKALLCTLAPAELQALLTRTGLKRYTESTLVTPADLVAALDRARRQGYAFDDEEHAAGLRCVAAPVFDEHGEAMAAISLSGPRTRIPDHRVPELGSLVSRTARELTAALGGRMPAR